MNYVETGHGPAIVLVHGFPLDGRVWDEVAQQLSSRARVIVPDIRGFGRNAPEDAFTMDDLAADLAGLMEMLGIAPCPVAGLSMGGYVVQTLAKNYPGIATRVFLVDTKAEADTPEGRAKRDVMAELALAQGATAVAEQMAPNMTSPNAEPRAMTALRSIMDSQPPRTLAAACRAMRDRADFRDFLPTLDVPVDFVFGDADAISPADAVRPLVAQLKNGSLTVIPNAGHMSPVEQPQAVAEVLAKAVA